MNEFIEIIGSILIVAGAFFMVTGAVGVLRFPHFFSRLHPASVSDSFGAPMVIVGVMLHHGFSLFTAKLAILALFLLITSATASHILAKTAFLQGMNVPKKSSKPKSGA